LRWQLAGRRRRESATDPPPFHPGPLGVPDCAAAVGDAQRLGSRERAAPVGAAAQEHAVTGQGLRLEQRHLRLVSQSKRLSEMMAGCLVVSLALSQHRASGRLPQIRVIWASPLA